MAMSMMVKWSSGLDTHWSRNCKAMDKNWAGAMKIIINIFNKDPPKQSKKKLMLALKLTNKTGKHTDT